MFVLIIGIIGMNGILKDVLILGCFFFNIMIVMEMIVNVVSVFMFIRWVSVLRLIKLVIFVVMIFVSYVLWNGVLNDGWIFVNNSGRRLFLFMVNVKWICVYSKVSIIVVILIIVLIEIILVIVFCLMNFSVKDIGFLIFNLV